MISSQRALQIYCTPFIRDTNLAGAVCLFQEFFTFLARTKITGKVPNENRFDQKNSILTSRQNGETTAARALDKEHL